MRGGRSNPLMSVSACLTPSGVSVMVSVFWCGAARSDPFGVSHGYTSR
jgi:hypothetical protein